MPTRKIAEPKDRGYCRDREHNPPSMMVYENGLYEHECPSCGAKTVFRVNKPTFSSSGGQASSGRPACRLEIRSDLGLPPRAVS